MKIERFEDIVAWQLGRELTQEIYRKLGPCRDFGFKDQLQRAVISIMNNVAEGFGRKGDKELVRYLKISKGSCLEARSMLYVAKDLDYLSSQDFEKYFYLTVRIEQALIKFIQALDSRP